MFDIHKCLTRPLYASNDYYVLIQTASLESLYFS